MAFDIACSCDRQARSSFSWKLPPPATRAKDYVREFNAALAPWRRETAVREFTQRTRTELGVAA
ncbi:hypothetical protein [Streptomyces sp. NPDC058268]|uniref:hypothetical protein n=1 Tax=Streptomyces sp. NPDC058268 TaxID=3346413 RepID=UPI0036E85E26